MSDASTSPLRFRFGLRTLFVLVTVAAVASAWTVRSLAWINERHEVLKGGVIGDLDGGTRAKRAPAGRWILGEKGVDTLIVDSFDESELKRASRLFPEAIVTYN